MAAEIVVAKNLSKITLLMRNWINAWCTRLVHNWARNIQRCIRRVIVPTRWQPQEKGWQPPQDSLYYLFVFVKLNLNHMNIVWFFLIPFQILNEIPDNSSLAMIISGFQNAYMCQTWQYPTNLNIQCTQDRLWSLPSPSLCTSIFFKSLPDLLENE